MRKHWVLGIALGLSVIATDVMAQSVSDLSTEVNTLSGRVGQLESEYLRPAMLQSRYRTEARFNDAKVAHFLKDYQRSSVLFVDIVQKEQPSWGSYRESLYLLGDSLFHLRNYKSARRYFKQVLDSGPGPFYEESAQRYLEIAFETRNYDGVDEMMARLQSGGNSPALSYISGKTLYRQGKFSEARAAFARAKTNSEYAMVAAYFEGVALAADKKIDEAQRVFFELTERGTPLTVRDTEILELAYVAQGRLAYEKGDFDTAIDMYQRLPRNSEHFDRALWEFTWVLIAQEKYRQARQNVEILLLSEPDPAFEPQAKLLKADLSVRIGDYDLAEQDFREVVDKYGPLKKQMDEFASQQTDLQTFFSQLVEDEIEGREPRAKYPSLVAEWLESDPSIRSASQLIRDVENIGTEIDESIRTLQEINARLDSSTRIQSFPKLAEGMTLGIETEARLVEIRAALVRAHHKEVSGSFNGNQTSEWEQISARLAAYDKRFKAMPTTRKQMAERERVLFKEFDRLKRQLDTVSYEIDSQRAQLTAVDTYIEQQYGRPLTDSEKKRIDALRDEIRTTIHDLEKLQEDISHEIRITREQVGMGDPVVIAESKIREGYARELARAEQFLNTVSGGSSNTINTIRGTRERIPPLEARLAKYFSTMNQLVDEKVADIRRDVKAEEQLVIEHRESLQELVYTSQDGAGVLAYLNFMRARGSFNELVLRGEVGLIDVMWQQKEKESNDINQLFEDRTSELNMLGRDFKEVR